MIVSQKKPIEEVMGMLSGVKKVALVGCKSCATACGVGGEKELLRTVRGGESCDETIALDDKYDHEKTVYIILESSGKCVDGDFEFEYN